MKVIFLDVDGVLRTVGPAGSIPAPSAITALNHLTQSTHAVLVLSSDLRMSGKKHYVSLLREWGVEAEIVGHIPVIPRVERGAEIGAWLLAHPEVSSFVILDDNRDMGGHQNRLVQTDGEVGLTLRDTQRAAQILSHPLKLAV